MCECVGVCISVWGVHVRVHVCVCACVCACVCVCVSLLQGLEAERSVHLEYSIYLVKLVPPGGGEQKSKKSKNTISSGTQSWLYTGMNISESLI